MADKADQKVQRAARKRKERQRTEERKNHLRKLLDEIRGRESNQARSPPQASRVGAPRKHLDANELLPECINAVKEILEGREKGVQRSRKDDSSLLGHQDAPRLLSAHSDHVPLPYRHDCKKIVDNYLREGMLKSERLACILVRVSDMVVIESSKAVHLFEPWEESSGYVGQSLYYITTLGDHENLAHIQSAILSGHKDAAQGSTFELWLRRIMPDEESDNLIYGYSLQCITNKTCWRHSRVHEDDSDETGEAQTSRPLMLQRIVETIFDTWHRSLTLMAIHKTKSVYDFVRRDAKGSEIALVGLFSDEGNDFSTTRELVDSVTPMVILNFDKNADNLSRFGTVWVKRFHAVRVPDRLLDSDSWNGSIGLLGVVMYKSSDESPSKTLGYYEIRWHSTGIDTHAVAPATEIGTRPSQFFFNQECMAHVLSKDDQRLVSEMAQWMFKANNHTTYSWFSEGEFPAMGEFEARFGNRTQRQATLPPLSDMLAGWWGK